MRVAGVLIDGYVRAFFGDDSGFVEFAQHKLLQIVFGDGLLLLDGVGGVFEGLPDDAIDGAACGGVRFELRAGPTGFIFLHEIGGGDDFGTETAHEFDGSGIDHGDIGNGIFRGVLHGHSFGFAQGFFEIVSQLFLAGVVKRVSGNGGERTGFNFVNEFFGSALGGNKIIPAAGAHAGRKIEDALGDGIAAAKIVEEPAVYFCGAQILLQFTDGDLHESSSLPRARSSCFRLKQVFNLLPSDANDFDALGAALFTAPDSNSRFRGFQNGGEELDKGFIGAIFDGGSAEANFHGAIDDAGDFVAAGAGLHAHGKCDGAARGVDGKIDEAQRVTLSPCSCDHHALSYCTGGLIFTPRICAARLGQ